MDYSVIPNSLDDDIEIPSLFQVVVDTPFSNRLRATELGLGIVVLLLTDQHKEQLYRVALSDTEMARGAVSMSAKPFHEIIIPISTDKNILVTALKSHKFQVTEDWANLFTPELNAEESRFNQAGAGIACSFAWPLVSKEQDMAFGVMIFSYFESLKNIGESHKEFMQIYSETVAAKLVSMGVTSYSPTN